MSDVQLQHPVPILALESTLHLSAGCKCQRRRSRDEQGRIQCNSVGALESRTVSKQLIGPDAPWSKSLSARSGWLRMKRGLLSQRMSCARFFFFFYACRFFRGGTPKPAPRQTRNWAGAKWVPVKRFGSFPAIAPLL